MAENQSFAKQYDTYAGKTLGNYYLERLSEKLETGPVFLARHTDAATSHHLRILALPVGLTPDERLVFLGHFQREASQAASLQHPSILPLNDYGIYEGVPYLVSSDLLMRPFQASLTEKGPVDASRAGRFLDGMAAALEYVHQQGILHLNLNARTVGLKADGQPIVAEAGLLRMLSPRMNGRTTDEQIRLENGTPLLADRQGRPLYGLSIASAPAPELLLGQAVDASTDVYALGALLYQLLTSHWALRAATLPELAQQHLKAAIPPLSTWRQGLPGELDQLLSRAMAKDSSRRFRTPGAFANAYATIVASGVGERKPFMIAVPTPAAPARESMRSLQTLPRPASIPARPVPGRQAPVSRRRVITLIAAGGGVAAAAGVAVWFIERNNTSSAANVASTSETSPAQTTGSSGTASSTSTSTRDSSGAGTGHRGKVLANVSDVPTNSAKSFPLPNSPHPGLLIHLASGSFVAFDSTCTHAGCAVTYNPQDHLLECPCHSASFDPSKNAQVVSGPAPSPLTPIAITVNSDGTITENG